MNKYKSLKAIEHYKEYQKIYRNTHKKEMKVYKKDYYRIHKTEILEQCKKYRKEHKEDIKKYFKNNKEKINQYYNNKRKQNINFKLKCNLKGRIWDALKHNYKSKSTLKLLGCSIEQFKQHLESQFKLDMSWSNYGKWHIDHIRPCAKFDLSKASEQRKCFHYTNLQPLWALENLSKGSK